jgi:hypothetical protein
MRPVGVQVLTAEAQAVVACDSVTVSLHTAPLAA